MTKLENKTALATGASRGIGRVAFLASEDARWITGASIPVDGGSKL